MTVSQSSSPSSPALLRRLLAHYRPHRALAGLALVCLLVHMAAELLLPWMLGRAIDTLVRPGGWPIAWWAGLFLAVGLIRSASRFGQGVAQTRLAQRIVTDLRLAYHERLLDLSLEDHRDLRRGELIARGTRDIEKTRAFHGDIFFQAIELALLLGGSLAVMHHTTPAFGWLALALVALCGGTMALAAPELRRRVRESDDSYDEVTTAIQETVAGTRVVKAFRREADQIERFAGHNRRYLERLFRAFDYFSLAMPGANILFGLAVPLALAIGGWQAMQGKLALGQIAAAIFYLNLIQNRLRSVGRIVMTSQTAAASAERLFEVIDRRPSVACPARPRALPDGGGAIVIDGVSFRYPDGTPVLDGVALEVRPGERLALVGPTGSGKSTLVGLLARFADPTSGRILLDGADLRQLDPRALRRQVGIVFQETFLFSASVASNIAFGAPDASRDEIERAARLACAGEFIEALPAGYDTLVGERGVTLSGGQKQRLAVARAILLRPRVLVLDDATASLDSRTERALHRGLEQAGRPTTIVIAQRLSTVRGADRILVLDGGKIREEGRHDELVGRRGWYAEIHDSQHEAA